MSHDDLHQELLFRRCFYDGFVFCVGEGQDMYTYKYYILKKNMFDSLKLYSAAVRFPEADSVGVAADFDANQTAAAARAQR